MRTAVNAQLTLAVRETDECYEAAAGARIMSDIWIMELGS